MIIVKNLGPAVCMGFIFLLLAGPAGVAQAATSLKLNPSLDYTSDSNDGPLITGEHLSDGSLTKGTPAYIIFYRRECYNSKQQARRTVELYEKYRGKVDFIIVDLDTELSSEQEALRSSFYKNYIPHVTILDSDGNVVYNRSGEVSSDVISALLDPLL